MSDLAAVSTAWLDRYWDGDAQLVRLPVGIVHGVRETVCYALGLLMRADHGDVDRARSALGSVLAQQLAAPGERYHGTFKRAPEESDPAPDALEWRDYDPNWRQFIGCTLALVDDGFGEGLGHDLRGSLHRSIALAVEGEPADRVPPSYSNIAMIRAWLDGWYGVRNDDRERVERGEAMARAVADRYDDAGGFDEFNSPTYYGVDLFALALWRGRPPTDAFAELGARLESELWRDIAQLYHAGMRNLCGPWTRSYGMDMTHSLGLAGLHVWEAIGSTSAPVPDVRSPFEHAHDLCFGPLVSYVPTAVPDHARPHLESFIEPRSVDRTVARWKVTAHLAAGVMTGAFDGPMAASDQFHPATAHWMAPEGGVGWLKVRPRGLLAATAVPGGLRVSGGPFGVDVVLSAPGAPVSFDREPSERADDGATLHFEEGMLEIDVGTG